MMTDINKITAIELRKFIVGKTLTALDVELLQDAADRIDDLVIISNSAQEDAERWARLTAHAEDRAEKAETEVSALKVKCRNYLTEKAQALDLAEKAEAERDAALAQLAAAFELAAKICDNAAWKLINPQDGSVRDENRDVHNQCLDLHRAIRTLTPADAAAALQARDDAAYARGVRDAEKVYVNYGPDFNGHLADKILAMIPQKEADDE